jgi:hypothetical protein
LLVQAAAKVAERIRKDMPPPALLRFFPESPLRPADSFMSKENEGMSEGSIGKGATIYFTLPVSGNG